MTLAPLALLLRLFTDDGRTQDFVPATTPPCAPSTAATIRAAGYLGFYDPQTIPLWPQKLRLLKGNATAQGPLVSSAQALARSSGNPEARFVFYFSLSDMDSQGGGFDPGFYTSFIAAHPEWILHDATGQKVSTNNGLGRVFATDIGNPAYVDAWATYATVPINQYGWNGVFVDNVIRCIDPPYSWSGWSAKPIDPRTGQTYTCADYRKDMVAALARLGSRFHPMGKLLHGNHSGAWHGTTFADPLVHQEVALLDGVETEDCLADYNGHPYAEADLLDQLRYADYASALAGHAFECHGPLGATTRETTAAFVALTTRGEGLVSELNTVGSWWSLLDQHLGTPITDHFEAIDASGISAVAAPGRVYRRRFAAGVAVWNPTTVNRTVPLGQATACGTTVTLAPGAGRICQ